MSIFFQLRFRPLWLTPCSIYSRSESGRKDFDRSRGSHCATERRYDSDYIFSAWPNTDMVVLSIVASPTLSSDVRNKATHLLKSLYGAYSTDKTDPNRNLSSTSSAQASAQISGKNREAEHLSDELNTTEADSHIESVPVQTGTILRVHGIYMDRRRQFEIRVNSSGNLELYDSDRREKWDKKAEAERDRLEKESKKKEEEQDKENKKLEKAELAEKESSSTNKQSTTSWIKGWVGKGKKSGETSDGDDTDVEGDDGDSTSVMLDHEKEGEVTILERRPTLKERLDGLVHPTLDASGSPVESAVHVVGKETLVYKQGEN